MLRKALCANTLFTLLHLSSYAIAVGPPTVLTFDDINTPGNVSYPMPAGYGGVNWPVGTIVYSFIQDLGSYPPQSSPNRVAFTLNGEPAVGESLVRFFDGPEIFDGAYFSGRTNVQFKLYSGGTLVGTSSILTMGPASNPPTFLASGYTGPVDSVGIAGDRRLMVMDNFTFEEVPEPSTLSLLGIGAISLLGYKKARLQN